MIVLGIDPGTREAGYGVISVEGRKETALDYGSVSMPASMEHSLRLQVVYDKVIELADQYLPDACAVEVPFMGKNPQSMLKLVRAQGAVMLAAMHREIPIVEYAPGRNQKVGCRQGAGRQGAGLVHGPRPTRADGRPRPRRVRRAGGGPLSRPTPPERPRLLWGLKRLGSLHRSQSRPCPLNPCPRLPFASTMRSWLLHGQRQLSMLYYVLFLPHGLMPRTAPVRGVLAKWLPTCWMARLWTGRFELGLSLALRTPRRPLMPTTSLVPLRHPNIAHSQTFSTRLRKPVLPTSPGSETQRPSDADLERTGIHATFGPVTLRQLLATWVAHDHGHMVQITRTLAHQYRAEVGPWTDFLSVFNRE